MQAANQELLFLSQVTAGYNKVPVVHDVSLSVHRGEAVAILGSNGAGKSTILRSIVGEIGPLKGTIRFHGHDISQLIPQKRIAMGLGYAPEGRHLFASMTVRENIEVGANRLPESQKRQVVDEIFEVFPKLKPLHARPCRLLSGGEQQMVAVGRALAGRPELLILDEPSTGLSPRVVSELYAALTKLHRGGLTVLVVEQNVRSVLKFCSRAYTVTDGCLTTADVNTLGSEDALTEAYFGNLHRTASGNAIYKGGI